MPLSLLPSLVPRIRCLSWTSQSHHALTSFIPSSAPTFPASLPCHCATHLPCSALLPLHSNCGLSWNMSICVSTCAKPSSPLFT
jgi:hypothetical protein